MMSYGMGYFETLQLPLTTFWSLNRQVDRLRAENEQRLARVHAYTGSEDPKALKALNDELSSDLGRPIWVDKEFDQSKFDELAAKFKNMRSGQAQPE